MRSFFIPSQHSPVCTIPGLFKTTTIKTNKTTQLKQQIKKYLKELSKSEHYDEHGEYNVFKQNIFVSDCLSCTCTSSAMLIANRFKGKVYGYNFDDLDIHEEDKAKIGYGEGGHDFCVVGDLLIDWWAIYVNGNTRGILDMKNQRDRKYIEKYYLPYERWEELEMWKKKTEARKNRGEVTGIQLAWAKELFQKFNRQIDDIEVHPVCLVDPIKSKDIWEVCEPAMADMWSVYIHIPGEGVQCIADCETDELAYQLADLLQMIGRNFVQKD